MYNSTVFPNLKDWRCGFPVVERTASWTDRHDKGHEVEKFKALVGLLDGSAHFLSYVGIGYKLLLNIEVFHYIFAKLEEVLTAEQLEGVAVTEHIDYGGRDSYIEIVFPNVRCDIAGRGDVAFRMIFGNSYGGKSVSCIAGAIDFFCTNGMVTGSFETKARRHTSGFTLTGLDKWITDSLDEFTTFNTRLQEYASMTFDYTSLMALTEVLADQRVISHQFSKSFPVNVLAEAEGRGGVGITEVSVWDVYSAMTTFATHADVRKTGNDHEFSTRMKRMRDADVVARAAAEWYAPIAA